MEQMKCYRVQCVAVLGTFSEEAGFIPITEAPEYVVSELIRADVADESRWENVLSVIGRAFHQAFNKTPK